MTDIRQAIADYVPRCEQEEKDRAFILAFLERNPDAFFRSNPVAHMTASAWVVNPARDRVLMVWHNLYRSWSWTGGHADGETDLLAVARREAEEESGVTGLRAVLETPLSVEILTVEGHEKRGRYVSSHLHYNVTYLFEADATQPLRMKPDENSGAAWFTPADALAAFETAAAAFPCFMLAK